MNDSKSLEKGSTPFSPIRFTRNFQKIVSPEDLNSIPTDNPHCFVKQDSKEEIELNLKKLLKGQIKLKSNYDYLEYYSANLTGKPHLGNEFNVIFGNFYQKLTGLKPKFLVNDLGNNFCRVLVADQLKPKLSYEGSFNLKDDQFLKKIREKRFKIFEEGFSEKQVLKRDQMLEILKDSGKKLSVPEMDYIYQSSFREKIKNLFEICTKDELGRYYYKGLVVSNSDLSPLYAAGDITYRNWVSSKFKTPMIVVGRDQYFYHKNLNQVVPEVNFTVVTYPSLKLQGLKFSKRKGHNLKLKGLIKIFQKEFEISKDSNLKSFKKLKLSSKEMKDIISAHILSLHRTPAIDLVKFLKEVSKILKIWVPILYPEGDLEETKNLKNVLKTSLSNSENLNFLKIWGYAEEVLQLALDKLDPGIVFKYLEELNLRNKSNPPILKALHLKLTRKFIKRIL